MIRFKHLMTEEESLVQAKAKAYESIMSALQHIADSCDQSFYTKAGIKQLANDQIKKANKSFKDHLKRFPD